jgi:hypothetical protein
MPPHNAIIPIRPRSLATIRDDIVEARRDYDDALADKHEDRANEAETRLTDLHPALAPRRKRRERRDRPSS